MPTPRRSIRVSDTTWAKWKERAKELGKTVSGWLREIARKDRKGNEMNIGDDETDDDAWHAAVEQGECAEMAADEADDLRELLKTAKRLLASCVNSGLDPTLRQRIQDLLATPEP